VLDRAIPRGFLSPVIAGAIEKGNRARLSLAATLIAAAIFYFSPWLPLTLVSGLGLAGLILLRLDLGLALIAVTAPFYRYPRPLFGKAFSMAEILTLMCLLPWLYRGVKRIGRWYAGQREKGTHVHSLPSLGRTEGGTPSASLDLAVLFFVLVATASLFIAEYRHVALRELRVVILEPAMFYLMLRTSELSRKALWRVVDFFVAGAVVVAVIGLVQYTLGINVITAEEGFRRLRSVYGSPNNAGLYLGRVLPVLIAITLFGHSRVGVNFVRVNEVHTEAEAARSHTEGSTATHSLSEGSEAAYSHKRRLAYGLAIAPVGLALLFSFSKGALMLGVPLSLVALGMLAGRPWSWASLGILATAAAAAAPLLHTPRFASLLDTQSGTTFFRLQLWRAAWTMFYHHPWLGVGLDNFLYQYRGRYILPAAWQEPDLSHPHNILLDYGCRLGLLGLTAGLWLQTAFWRVTLPLRHVTWKPEERPTSSPQKPSIQRRAEAIDRRALALGMMGSMVNHLAHGLVDASYFVIDLAFVFFLTLGVVQWLARRTPYELET
jgi:O-antigen ligase